jgi:hypothetical protein
VGRAGNERASHRTRRGEHAMLWTIIVVVVIVLAVIGLMQVVRGRA